MTHTVERGLTDGVVGVLLEFALTMTTDPEPGQIVSFLADHAADVLPVDAAAAMVMDRSAAPLRAASDPGVLDGEHFQFVSRDGPGWLTWASSVAITIVDLEADSRFPGFRHYGAAPGVRSVFTFPLRRGEVRLGALSLYRTRPGRPSPGSRRRRRWRTWRGRTRSTRSIGGSCCRPPNCRVAPSCTTR